MAETHPGAVSGPTTGPAPESLSDVRDSASGPRSSTGPSAGAPTAAELAERTWTVLIAALGGEGGGVLSNWLVDAAATDGRTVQATSVPGVAQRTGATTYYLEIGPRDAGAGGARRPGVAAPAAAVDGTASSNAPSSKDGPSARAPDAAPGFAAPVMALLPTPGNVDLLVASELLEAGRAAQSGMITPDRTAVIASTHRTFAIAEKSAMGDGRFEDERIRRAVRELSRRHVLTDLGRVAEQAGTVLSSVLLGAVAGSEALPIPRARLRAAIERAGIAVEANLRGFEAGCRLFDESTAGLSQSGTAAAPAGTGPGAAGAGTAHPPVESGVTSGGVPDPFGARVNALPAPVREFARLGVERAVDYQDGRYGTLYLDRIERLLARAVSAGAAPEDAHGVAREVARQLALWMCFEDIIRVADLKTRRSRIERVRTEVRAEPGQPVVVTEFLKPGVDEWCSLLPPGSRGRFSVPRTGAGGADA